jgi:hypothetical protein
MLPDLPTKYVVEEDFYHPTLSQEKETDGMVPTTLGTIRYLPNRRRSHPESQNGVTSSL